MGSNCSMFGPIHFIMFIRNTINFMNLVIVVIYADTSDMIIGAKQMKCKNDENLVDEGLSKLCTCIMTKCVRKVI